MAQANIRFPGMVDSRGFNLVPKVTDVGFAQGMSKMLEGKRYNESVERQQEAAQYQQMQKQNAAENEAFKAEEKRFGGMLAEGSRIEDPLEGAAYFNNLIAIEKNPAVRQRLMEARGIYSENPNAAKRTFRGMVNSTFPELLGGGKAKVKPTEGDVKFKDEAGNIFLSSSFMDPNTQTTQSILTDASGQQSQPQGRLTPIGPKGQTAAERATSAIETAQGKAEAEADVALETSRGVEEEKEFGKKSAQRDITLMETGLNAADSLPVLRRSLSLLEGDVKTGGIQSTAGLAIKQYLGVESANEGELSANLGKSILAQLRPIFGAQFTEREGKRLENIEAGFGKNNETNLRLIRQTLQIAEKSANRAIDIAIRKKDYETAAQIQKAMDFEFSFPDVEGATPSIDLGGQQQPFTSKSGVNFTVE